MISVEEFVSGLGVGAKERGRYEDDITAYIEYCESNRLEVLNRNSKEAFIELIRPKRKTPKTVSATISRIERYIVANEERSRQIPMVEENMKEPETMSAGVDDSASTESTAANEPESWPKADPVKERPNPTRNKGGRKPLDTENGETRSEKMTAYFTPSMAENIRLWCDWTGISFGDLTVKLFGAFLKDKEEMLKDFRKSREEAKRLNES